MKLLILSQNYPRNKNAYAQMYIHTRLMYYKQQSVEVEVISFNCKSAYVFEGIEVHPAKVFKQLVHKNNYDAIICHAPNIRNHLRLILFSIYKLPKIFFFFHGHEILKRSKYYPQDYVFNQGLLYDFRTKLFEAYDFIKCFILKQIIKKFGGRKIFLVFVSKYLKKLFVRNIGLSEGCIKDFSIVIHNPLNPIFIDKKYYWSRKKLHDFITIRPFDKPVYALDIVLEIARQNPDNSFHIYGKGNFFDHNKPPKNVTIYKTFLSPADIQKKLNLYKVALMPSYHDSQGVMVCEMAAFGIPIVVSNIPAAKEMFSKVKNKFLINNKNPQFDATEFLKGITPKNNVDLKVQLSVKKTIDQELAFIYSSSRKKRNLDQI